MQGGDSRYAFRPGPAPLVEIIAGDRAAAAESLNCRVGALSFPFALCRERFETPGLVARLLGRDPSFDAP